MKGGAAVADDTETTETETESAPSNAELDAKVTALDTKLDRIIDMFGGIKDQAHERAAEHTEDRLDRPSSIAEEIRQQLAGQRAKDEAAAAQTADADWRKSVDDRLTGMAEKVPEAPVRRVENIMGWR